MIDKLEKHQNHYVRQEKFINKPVMAVDPWKRASFEVLKYTNGFQLCMIHSYNIQGSLEQTGWLL